MPFAVGFDSRLRHHKPMPVWRILLKKLAKFTIRLACFLLSVSPPPLTTTQWGLFLLIHFRVKGGTGEGGQREGNRPFILYITPT